MSERPNFLFIITDQQRADHLGCYGNRVVRTPVIDRLAVAGSRFNRFYVTSPSCQPNRASIMTGRMPSLHGVHHNGVPLAHEATTFVDLLREAGYRTALLGKAHLQNFTGRPPVQRFAPEEGLQAPPPAMQDASKARRDGPDYQIENEFVWPAPAMQRWHKPYYGFEHFEIASNHGDLVAGDYLLWARERRADFDTLRGREHAAGLSPSGAPQAWRTRIREDLYPTSYVAERTIAWLEMHRRERRAAPFFIQMSFPDPHYPFTPPGRYWDMYDPAQIALPDSFDDAGPPPVRAMKEALKAGRAFREGHAPFAASADEARAIIALTYGMITMIDDAVGRVLDTLSRLDLARNTIVIFTSDHGDYMADHGIMLKAGLHYQGLIRVPFIWREPDGSLQVSEALGSSIDIPATILRRAGLQTFHGMQGRNLLDPATDPDGILVESDNPGFAGDVAARTRTLVPPRWRLSLYKGAGGELYDLERDPGEMNNLWDDAASAPLRAELQAFMADRLIAMQDSAPLQTGLS